MICRVVPDRIDHISVGFGSSGGSGPRPMMFARRVQSKGIGRGSDNIDVEENLNPLQRARYFGTSRLSLQRIVCVQELVDTAHEVGYEQTVAHLIPLVRNLASDPEVLVRHSLVMKFGGLAGFLIQSEPDGEGYQKVVDDLLPILSKLLTEKSVEVWQGAADSLITVASHLRPANKVDKVLMTVIQLSQNNDDEDARATAVQLLNGLAETLGPDLCQQFVCVELVSLCEDGAFRVRKMAASNFTEIAKVVGEEHAVRRLLPAFVKLVEDAHWGVRKAAAESLPNFAATLSAPNRQEPFVQLMGLLLKDASRWVRISSLQQLGYFIAILEDPQYVPVKFLNQFADIIEQAKMNPEASEISYHCAYVFSAVMQTMGKGCWAKLEAPFTFLCQDGQARTRKVMAASMPVVIRTLGAELAEEKVLPIFDNLLQDCADEAKLAALHNVGSVLLEAPLAKRRILKALQATLSEATNNWRLRHLVASQIGAISDALALNPSTEVEAWAESEVKDLAWSIMVPIFLLLCRDGVAEVRNEAARGTAQTLRTAAPELFMSASTSEAEGSSGCSSGIRSTISPDASRLVRTLFRTFAQGTSYRSRVTYIRMCDAVIRESPTCVLTKLLLRQYIKLASDPVRNVRHCWACMVMPHLRKAGRLVDRPAIVSVAVKLARTDADKEVRRVLEGIPLTELPDSWSTDSLGGTESDETDDVDRVVNEGGTGYSSECSDGELPLSPCNDVVHAPSSPNATSPTAVESRSVMPSCAEGGGTSIQLASVEVDSSPKQSDPTGGSPRTGPLRDLVEDSLVEQGDVERVMDATFADRRLLMEVEGNDAENAALETNTQVVTQSTDENITLTEEVPGATQSESTATSTMADASVATYTTPDMSDMVDTPSDGHLTRQTEDSQTKMSSDMVVSPDA